MNALTIATLAAALAIAAPAVARPTRHLTSSCSANHKSQAAWTCEMPARPKQS
jgi:hypothetical protein